MTSDDGTRPPDEHRLDLVGDGYDPEPLLKAEELGRLLGVPARAVYDLPIPRVRVGRRRVRWRPADVRAWIERRMERP